MTCGKRERYVFLGHHVIRKIGSKKSVLGVSAALEKEAGRGVREGLADPPWALWGLWGTHRR